IAFSSDRNGHYDVFVIAAEGGYAKQLTFRSSNDEVTGWTGDGTGVIFHSRRDLHFYYGNSGIFSIPVKGGMPYLMMDQMGKSGSLSGDGNYLVFNINRIPEFRQRYRGPANNDVWLYNIEKDRYRKLTDHQGNDKWPVFGSGGVYYVSDKDDTFNLWKMDNDGKNKVQLTFHKGDQVRYPAISPDGKFVIYEYLNKLYRKNSGEDAYPLEIYAATENKSDYIVKRFYSSKATEMKVSPDGKYYAFVIRGEIFVLKKGWKRAKNISDSPYREANISWTSDNKGILFDSDKNGNRDIFIVYPEGERDIYHSYKYKLKQLTDSESEEGYGVLSPDNKKVLYIKGNGNLVLRTIGEQTEQILLKGWNVGDLTWSPDGNYLSYSHLDDNFTSDVYIYDLKTGKPYNISRHPDDDHFPVWSPDGKFLYFISRRSNNNMDIWRLALKKEWFEMTPDEWKKMEEDKKKKVPAKKDEKKVSEVKPHVLTIDFKNIHRRVTHLTELLGDEYGIAVSPDSKTIAFTAGNDEGRGLYKIGWDGKGKKNLIKKGKGFGSLHFAAKGENLFFIESGMMNTLNIKKGPAKPIPFNAKLTIDMGAENIQKFEEAWRAMRDNFYDGRYHGADWNGIYKKYRPWINEGLNRYEFDYIFTMILGELNGSHLRITSRMEKERKTVLTGDIGVLFDDEYTGPGFKIETVLKESPAFHKNSRLAAGDIITSINGEEAGTGSNFYMFMEDKAGEPVMLQVLRGENKLDVEIIPVKSNRNFIYNSWIERNQKKVEELSGGKLAYVHIQSMGWPNLEKFERELHSIAYGKEGLVIDVRYNGGGWITDYLLQILMTRQHAVTIPRGGGKGYPHGRRSIFAYTKPIVVLINQMSYSNAEIFPWSIRTLKRGALVGKQTFGAVISTGGTALIDGTWLRLPFRGWYVNDGTKTNMELNGCPPDFPVENLPGEEIKGVDRQLNKGVEVLLDKVKEAGKSKIWN
ncbi:MAG: S41 family peptidase, partial [Acidobacteriota bacterium]